jgi:hypothetical protein
MSLTKSNGQGPSWDTNSRYAGPDAAAWGLEHTHPLPQTHIINKQIITQLYLDTCIGNLACSGFELTKSLVPVPAGSSPYLQEPTTGPYPDPIGSTPPHHPTASLPKIHSDPILGKSITA